jgi:putative SOS response-associated peptidase YedK
MCGRYALFGPFSRRDPAWVAQWLEQLVTATGGEARYNIAPSQEVPAFVVDGDHTRVLQLRWGLIPSWARDTRIAYSTINARAESVSEKPAFRGTWRAGRRCLIPASGWYEWQTSGKLKQPWFIDAGAERNPLLLAGLWENWRGPDGAEIASCSIITVPANARIEHLHVRQPLVLEPDRWRDWLTLAPANAAEFLRAAADLPYAGRTVSRAVNNVRNDGPALLEAIE